MTASPGASVAVECLGLPGVGKTRHCSEAVPALRAAGVAARAHVRHRTGPAARLGTAAGLLALAAARPGYCARSLRRIRRAEPRDPAWLAHTWLKRSAAARRLRRAPGVTLVDAGLLQALWSLGFRAPDDRLDEAWRGLLSEAPLPDLVLVLDAGSETLERRLRQRPPPAGGAERLLVADPGGMGRGRALVDALVRLLAEPEGGRSAVRVIRLDSRDEGDLARNLDTLASLLGAGPAAAPRSPEPAP